MNIRQVGILTAVATTFSLTVIAFAITMLAACDVEAYSAAPRYGQETTRGGGGGRYFTGSPLDGFTCDVCHEGGTVVDVRVAGLPKDGYEPGRTYEISIRWETADTFTAVAEFMADDGAQAGVIALPADPSPETLCVSGVQSNEVFDEPGRQIAAVTPCGATRLMFEWTAPADLEVCASDAVLYVAGVHGDDTESPDGDGVTVFNERIPPAIATESCDPGISGCAIGTDSTGPIGWMLLLVIATFRGRKRR